MYIVCSRCKKKIKNKKKTKKNVSMPEWSKGTRLGRVGSRREGSNPSADKKKQRFFFVIT